MSLKRIETAEDIAEALAELKRADPRLEAIHEAAGEVPLRRRPGGFEGLVRVVVGQQLSVGAAEAIWRRLEAQLDGCTAEAIAAASDQELRAAGLSRQKIRTLRAVAEAAGHLDFELLSDHSSPHAHDELMAIHGIGEWTVDIYLMFCAGHPDVFPVGDLALRRSVAIGLKLDAPPSAQELAQTALLWSPHRATAARLFWAYYRVARKATGRSGRPPAETVPV